VDAERILDITKVVINESVKTLDIDEILVNVSFTIIKLVIYLVIVCVLDAAKFITKKLVIFLKVERLFIIVSEMLMLLDIYLKLNRTVLEIPLITNEFNGVLKNRPVRNNKVLVCIDCDNKA